MSNQISAVNQPPQRQALEAVVPARAAAPVKELAATAASEKPLAKPTLPTQAERRAEAEATRRELKQADAELCHGRGD